MSNEYKVPTREEYEAASLIVSMFKVEKLRLEKLQIEAFRLELENYFEENLIDDHIQLQEFQLELCGNLSGHIIPITPSMEENYAGENDEDIKKLCENHGVDFTMKYWCYHK